MKKAVFHKTKIVQGNEKMNIFFKKNRKFILQHIEPVISHDKYTPLYHL